MGGGQGLRRSIVVATYMFRLARQRQERGAFLKARRGCGDRVSPSLVLMARPDTRIKGERACVAFWEA
jgi:hypothetical protein